VAAAKSGQLVIEQSRTALASGKVSAKPCWRHLVAPFLASLSLICSPWPVGAAKAISQPLFEDHAPLHLVIQAPLAELIERKDDRPKVRGTVSYRDADSGAPIELTATISTRGRSRLEYCDFPPLRLNFRRRQVPGTLFAGQNKLKLVTHCRRGAKHARWVGQEYLVYRMFNLLTEQSFRVRWLNIDYLDTARDNEPTTAVGFVIEAANNLAKRVNMKRFREQHIEPEQLDASQAALVTLFHFMIGNTDWSILSGAQGRRCCHNGEALVPSNMTDGIIVVPYDFDQAGIIATDYAVPSPQLRLNSVRTRRFRGLCSHNDQLPATIAHFNAYRPALETLIDSSDNPDATKRTMERYLAAFYRIISDQDMQRARIMEVCRGPAS
jgi:hypothetical protein